MCLNNQLLFYFFLFFFVSFGSKIDDKDIPEVVRRSFGGLTKDEKIDIFGPGVEKYHKIYIIPRKILNIQKDPISILNLAVCIRKVSGLVNNKTVNYDYFLCPQEEGTQTYCCGDYGDQRCCSKAQFIGNFAPVRSDGFVPVASVIMMGVVFFGSINIGIIFYLNKRRLDERKLAKQNAIVVYSAVDNMSEVRGSSLISGHPSKPNSVIGRQSGNLVTANWVKSVADQPRGRRPQASPGASLLDVNSLISGKLPSERGSAAYSNLPPSASREFDHSSGIFSSRASTATTARPGNWSVDTANNIRKSRSRENISKSREMLHPSDAQSNYAPSLPAPSVGGFSQATGALSLASAPEYYSKGVKQMGPKGPRKSRRAEDSIGEVPEGTLSRWRKSQTDLDVFEEEPPAQEKLISAKPTGKGPIYAHKPIALSSMRSDGKKPKKEKYFEELPEPEPELNPSELFTPSVELVSARPHGAIGSTLTRSGLLNSDASYPPYSDPRGPPHANHTEVNKPPSGLISATPRSGPAKPKARQYRPPKIITARRGRSTSSSSDSD